MSQNAKKGFNLFPVSDPDIELLSELIDPINGDSTKFLNQKGEFAVPAGGGENIYDLIINMGDIIDNKTFPSDFFTRLDANNMYVPFASTYLPNGLNGVTFNNCVFDGVYFGYTSDRMHIEGAQFNSCSFASAILDSRDGGLCTVFGPGKGAGFSNCTNMRFKGNSESFVDIIAANKFPTGIEAVLFGDYIQIGQDSWFHDSIAGTFLGPEQQV